jgi:hypothetical protein
VGNRVWEIEFRFRALGFNGLGVRVLGLGFRVQCSGFRAQGLWGSRFRVKGSEFGFRAQGLGLGFGVYGLKFKD